MRVATWNIWNIQGDPARWQRSVPAILAECDADILLLQEISPDSAGIPQSSRLADALGMASERYFFAGEWRGREEGLAILSRFPMVRHVQRALSTGADGMGRVICGATLATPQGQVDVYTAHLAFPLSDRAGRHVQALEALAFITETSGPLFDRPVIFGGDLNDVPGSPAAQVFATSGLLRDACANLSPAARRTFTSLNPLVQADLGPDRCIDYLFHTPRWVTSSVELFGREAGGAYGSDHLGIKAVFEPSP